MPNQADGRLAEIVLKACAYRTADRYSSPVAMRKDLEAILYEESEAREIYPDGDKVSDHEGLRTNGTVSVKDFRKRKVQKQTETSECEGKEQRQESGLTESEEISKNEKCTGDRAIDAEKQDAVDSKGNEQTDEDYCGDDTVIIRRKNWKMEVDEPEKPEEKEEEAQSEEENTGQKIREEIENPAEKEGKTEPETGEENKEGNPEESEEHEEIVTENSKETDTAKPKTEVRERTGEQPEKKGKKLFFVIPAAVVAAVGAAAVLYLNQASKFSVVPDVCGVSFSEAEGKLQEAGFMAEMQREYSDTVPEDVVISQDMTEGEKQEKGSIVNLLVSAGEEPVEVPDVLAKKKKEAVKELEKAGFSVVIEEEYSGSKVNTVVSQSVEAGTETEKGQEIVLVISKKRPEVKGLPLQEALTALEGEGFTVTAVKGKSSRKAELNTVLGVSYQITDEKTAVLSLNCIQVPDIGQMEKGEAIAALTAAGFSGENISSEEEYNSAVDAGIVYEYQIQEEDWAALAGVPQGIELVLSDGQIPQGAKISLKVSLGAKPKANTGSSNSPAPSYTPAPSYSDPHDITWDDESHNGNSDEGVVFSDGEGRVVN